MRNYLIILFFMLSVSFAKGQGESYLPQTSTSVAYLGAMLSPGFHLGVERPYKLTTLHKTRFKSPLTLYKERYYGFSMNLYHVPELHANFYGLAEWKGRRQYQNGFYYDVTVGLGLSRTILDAETYEVNENGEVEQVTMAGKFYGIAAVSGTAGYNFYLKKRAPIRAYIKPGVVFLFPYNHYVLAQPTLEIGAAFRRDHFWKAKPKTFAKNKVRS